MMGSWLSWLMLTSLDDLKLSESGFADPPSSAASPSKSLSQNARLALPAPATVQSFDGGDAVLQYHAGNEVEEID